MFELKKKFKICAAHVLHNDKMPKDKNKEWFGKCNEVHGHNYYITLILRSKHDNLGPTGMIINFDNLKIVFKKLIDDVYDHKLLNECPGFKDQVVTAEYMAKEFYKILKEHVQYLYAIEVEETEGASATYWENEN